MKKFFMISVLMVALPLSMVAQDDLYFVPKKKRAEVVEVTTPINNRVKSQYEVIQNDSTNDIIDFDGQKGVYPDSIVTEDFELTKRMQRFDDYDLSDNAAFWAGYHLGRDTWNWGLSWHSPWYYTRYGWYGGFYDPGTMAITIPGTTATMDGAILGIMVIMIPSIMDTMAITIPGAMATMATIA